MLYDRIISALILIPVVIFSLFLLSVNQFALLLLIVCLISAWEWGKLMRFSINIHYIWMFVIFNLLYIIMKVIILNSLNFSFYYIFLYFFGCVTVYWILMFLLILFYPYSAVFWKTSNILRFFYGILIIFPFFCGVLILYQFDYINNNIEGKWWLLYILTLVWMNDSIAYIIGQSSGKYKLLKNISPNKTWEGCISGILVSSIIAWLFIKYMILDTNNPYIIFICFIITIIFSIIGDLTESMFKRESGIKDISNLIPGHGGCLDRIDSLCAAIPIFTVLLLLTNFLVFDN